MATEKSADLGHPSITAEIHQSNLQKYSTIPELNSIKSQMHTYDGRLIDDAVLFKVG